MNDREKLPIFCCKADILESVKKSRTIIFVGETGSGKTTQIPQYLYETGLHRNKCIAVTQPRRVAAVQIAKRVAFEAKTEVGATVGYSVRFENVTSAATKIKYLTDGMLLRESITHPLLLDYSFVILDEAHERTLSNDILLGTVKSAQKLRREKNLQPLNIIVMSATLDCKQFSEYFNNCPSYKIPGRCYNVDILQPTKKQSGYVDASLATVFKIHQNEEKGDILVFCTGQEEIDYMVKETSVLAKHLPIDIGPIYAFPMYSALPIEQQTSVFNPAPGGSRKVIFSTNIAETSITIPGVKYVVDTGKVKAKSYNSTCGFDILLPQYISKAQAIQRSGRAGRECDGKCYRLYTDEQYRSFQEQTEPEILRCCLSSAILEMVAIGIRNIVGFDFIDKPSEENIAAAIKTLKLLDAVVEKNGLLELTECGERMVKFPLDPRYSKIIIESKKYRCTDEILTIVSLLSVDSIFYTKIDDRDQFSKARQKFERIEGDLLMTLDVYKQYKKYKGNPDWCRENFINPSNMRTCIAIRKQLYNISCRVNIPSINCNDPMQIQKCLATGLFFNVALLYENGIYKVVETNQEIKMHPSSCLFRRKNISCCLYTELVQTQATHILMKNLTYIPEEALISVKPEYFKTKMTRLATMKSMPILSS
ncbi:ATP-dependent RNA helicase DHX33 isoform X2 [Parasteatoda tepidariorum]|uniref:ATP-dependent RNA helicase DHX33 isoform X2 n=1 Tax=Parasteatoda tepidariorum TaxID=114398 RepID=UPI001C726AAC|nr:ATP-dependent RNA helicase DHX33 isoform X2 [Parasteatoda tepidariorum]